MVIRNNPLLKPLLKDVWEREFEYNQVNGGKSYELFSLGKDGIADTDDDIK